MEEYEKCVQSCLPTVLDRGYCISIYCALEASVNANDVSEINYDLNRRCAENFGLVFNVKDEAGRK